MLSHGDVLAFVLERQSKFSETAVESQARGRQNDAWTVPLHELIGWLTAKPD